MKQTWRDNVIAPPPNWGNSGIVPVKEAKAMTDEKAIEKQILAKRLTAPRVTPADIDATIVDETYHVFPGTTLTVCALTLRNGFIVTGESAAASVENFDQGIGQTIARDNARNKIWALEGYLLRQRLADAEARVEQASDVADDEVTDPAPVAEGEANG